MQIFHKVKFYIIGVYMYIWTWNLARKNHKSHQEVLKAYYDLSLEVNNDN